MQTKARKILKLTISLIVIVALISVFFIKRSKAANDETQTVTIQAMKTLAWGGDVTEGEFSFTLTPTSYQGETLRTTNDENGNITFNVTFTDDDVKWEDDTKQTGYLIYKINEVQGTDSTIRYDNNECYAVVKVERTETDDPVEGTIVTYEKSVTYAKPSYVEYEYEEEFASSVFHATEEELAGQAYAVFNPNDNSLIFFRDEEGKYTDRQEIEENGIRYIYYTGFEDESSSSYLDKRYQIETVIFRDAIKPTKISFSDFSNCTLFDLEKLDTSLMTDMYRMFQYNLNLETINISTFDTSNVTTMGNMFEGCKKLKNVVLGDFDTSNVTITRYMFHDTKIKQINMSAFETENFVDASSMFGQTDMQNADMSTWATNDHYDTSSIFVNFNGEYVDLTNFTTTHSADVSIRDSVKVMKVNFRQDHTYSRMGFFFNDMINIENGQYVRRYNTNYNNISPGTYVTMNDDDATFTNYKRGSIKINKTDIFENKIAGARMGLMMGDGLITTWVTGSTPKEFNNLKCGETYTIVELEAPSLYKEGPRKSFTVNENGDVIYGGEKVNEITIQNEGKYVEINKIWDDEENEDLRPESITFDLYDASDMDTILESVTLKKSDFDANAKMWIGRFSYEKSRGKYVVVERPQSYYNAVYKSKKNLGENEYLKVKLYYNAGSMGGHFLYYYDQDDTSIVHYTNSSGEILLKSNEFYIATLADPNISVQILGIVEAEEETRLNTMPIQILQNNVSNYGVNNNNIEDHYSDESFEVNKRKYYYYCYQDEQDTPTTDTVYIKNTFIPATGSITFEGNKSIETRDIRENEIFEFEMTDGENTWTINTDETGKINFPEITYTLRDVGTHTYAIKEIRGTGNGLVKDPTVYTVVVEVVDDGDETLEITASENSNALNFVNKESDITIRKSDINNLDEVILGAKFKLTGDNLVGVKVNGHEITEEDLDGTSYIFECGSIQLIGLYDGVYALEEIETPEGYEEASAVQFEVIDGIIDNIITDNNEDAFVSEDGKILTISNKKIEVPEPEEEQSIPEEEKEDISNSPKTDDEIIGYFAVLAVATVCMVILVKTKKNI